MTVFVRLYNHIVICLYSFIVIYSHSWSQPRKRKGSLRSFELDSSLMSRCEKTRYWRSGFFGKLTGLTACVSPFMIDHFTNRLQVFLHSVWIKMFWTERRASATDQGKSDRWQVKALIPTRRKAR